MTRDKEFSKQKYGTKSIQDSILTGGFVAGVVESEFSGDKIPNKSDYNNAVTRFKVIEAKYDHNGNPYIILSRDWRHSQKSLTTGSAAYQYG